MANYSGDKFGNQALNTSYKTDLVSQYHNKLLWNIFDDGIVNNYTNVVVCNEEGISLPASSEVLISWHNSEYGSIPLETNLYVKIELYKSNELFYIIDTKANNSGEYVFIYPTDIEITGIYRLKVTGLTDDSYYYEDKKWLISPLKDKYLKLRYQLSLFIKPNNEHTVIGGIKYKYENLSDTLDSIAVAQLKLKNQILKMDTTDNIILEVPDGYSDIDLYVVAEFNWIENNEVNSVLINFKDGTADYNQLNICKVHIDSAGDISEIYITNEGLLDEQTISTVNENVESYINVDLLESTWHAANTDDNIPISNTNLNVNLNTEKVDGYIIDDLALKNDTLVEDLNSEYLGLGDDVYKPGNEEGNIPISNTELCEGLNAEFVGGLSDVDLLTMEHEHPLGNDDILDGDLYKKLLNVGTDGKATNESFNDAVFNLHQIAPNTFLRDESLEMPDLWEASTTYAENDYVSPVQNPGGGNVLDNNGYIYRCIFGGVSAANFPDWAIVDGETVIDCISTQWVASNAYIVPDEIVPTAGKNGYTYICITPGTSDTSEPTWPTEIGEKVTDGSIEWETYKTLEWEAVRLNRGRLKLVTGSIEEEYTTSNGQISIGFGDQTFYRDPIINIQVTSDVEYLYHENVIPGTFEFTVDKYTITEAYDYVGQNVLLIIEPTTGVFKFDSDDVSGTPVFKIYATSETTVQDIIDTITEYSELLIAELNAGGDGDAVILQNDDTFACAGGEIKDESTYIKTYATNIYQSGFVLNWEVYREDQAIGDGKLYKQTGIQPVWCHWVAIGEAE